LQLPCITQLQLFKSQGLYSGFTIKKKSIKFEMKHDKIESAVVLGAVGPNPFLILSLPPSIHPSIHPSFYLSIPPHPVHPFFHLFIYTLFFIFY